MPKIVRLALANLSTPMLRSISNVEECPKTFWKPPSEPVYRLKRISCQPNPCQTQALFFASNLQGSNDGIAEAKEIKKPLITLTKSLLRKQDSVLGAGVDVNKSLELNSIHSCPIFSSKKIMFQASLL